MRARTGESSLAGAIVIALLLPTASFALTPLQSVRYSPDVTVELGGTLVTPQNVASDDLAGNVALLNVGTYGNGSDIIAYDLLANGNQLLAFDVDLTLPGGLTVRPGDVVRFDGATYSLEFDAGANGIPVGVQTDAVRSLGSGNLLLSFDVTVEFPSFTADDEDIVQFQSGVPSLFFDGSAHGVPTDLDLDALDRIASNGNLLLSFDASGTIGGVTFDDDDVLAYSPATNTWALAYAGSAEHAGWDTADLSALSAIPGGTGSPPAPFIQGGMPGPGGVGGSGGVPLGTTRLYGIGAPHPQPDDACIAIYSVGANRVPDVPPGSTDDELLGTGGTDANGSFVDAMNLPGIGLSRPLRSDDVLFAVDVCLGLVGAAAGVTAQAPPLTGAGLLLSVALMLVIARRTLRPSRAD
jgi:hypothetical protein